MSEWFIDVPQKTVTCRTVEYYLYPLRRSTTLAGAVQVRRPFVGATRWSPLPRAELEPCLEPESKAGDAPGRPCIG